MNRDADMEVCRAAIRTGSKSFHAASKLLPQTVRDPALSLYAFCRVADDAVDETLAKPQAVLDLRRRLDAAYAGTPDDTPIDRAFADMVAAKDLPKALPEALIEGFSWDAQGLRYRTISEVRAYSARVAAAVGAMMTVLMGVRDADALARACDLGVAMQLTNIARDVGEDAREGRLYLPMDWMVEAGLDPDAFLANPRPGPELARVVKRLLAEANRHYYRSEAGITALPTTCRPAIFAARLIYAEIGKKVRAHRYDSVTHRAHTSKGRKIVLGATALGRTLTSKLMPQSAVLYAAPMPECAFLVDAARDAEYGHSSGWDRKLDAITSTLMTLKQREMEHARAG